MNKNVLIIVTLLFIVGGVVVVGQSASPKTSTDSPSVATEVSNNQVEGAIDPVTTSSEDQSSFEGQKGQTASLSDGQVKINASDFETNKIKFFNTTLADGKTVYYLILKDDQGKFRAAANGHTKCAKYNKGHIQEGDQILCSICKDSVSVKDFALNDQKECTPKSISTNLPVESGSAIITQAQLESISNLF